MARNLYNSEELITYEIPHYHILNGLIVKTDGYISQIYLELYNNLQDVFPVYVYDFKNVLLDLKIKKNLNENEKLFYENLNEKLVEYFNLFNINTVTHDKGFDLISSASAVTILRLIRFALEDSVDATTKTINRQLERERERQKELDRNRDVGREEVEIDDELEL